MTSSPKIFKTCLICLATGLKAILDTVYAVVGPPIFTGWVLILFSSKLWGTGNLIATSSTSTSV